MSRNKSNDIEQIFLYQQWLHQRLDEYVKSSKPPKLHGREVIMLPNQYGAALMQAYLGKASLAWIAECAEIPLPLLRQWRQEADFPLAKNVIQPFLEQKEWVGTALKTIQKAVPISLIRFQLESKLNETFKRFL